LKEVVMDLKIEVGEIASPLPTTSKNSWSVFEKDNMLKHCWCMQSHYVHCKGFWLSHASGLSKNREISSERCVIRQRVRCRHHLKWIKEEAWLKKALANFFMVQMANQHKVQLVRLI
jgi:hypothetical protein